MGTTLAAIQAGSTSIKWTAVIEGIDDFVLSDCTDTSAVQAAYAGTDWAAATVIGGLFVELKNAQSIDPSTAFAGSGRCVLRVLDTDGSDTFGEYIAKRLSGAETELTITADRNDTTMFVKSTVGFLSSGTFHIGVESCTYSGTTATSFTGVTRGVASPFSCDTSGSGTRYSNHHRVGTDSRYIQSAPVITQLPRVWLGRRVAVHLHTWNGTSLNTRADSQLVFPGRIVGIADDTDGFTTTIELEHIAREWQEGVIGRDMLHAEIPEGMWIAAGRTFRFNDGTSTTTNSANDLTVVSSGAAGANQMNEGFYSNSQICEAWNKWLASEKTAGRIAGRYNWASPVVHRSDGLRTICQWIQPNGGSVHVNFKIEAPMEVLAFLGLIDTEPAQNGAMGAFAGGPGKYSNINYVRAGEAVPYSVVVFAPSGPGRIGQEFSEAIVYDLENERGTFVDQRALLPATVKELVPSAELAGLFLLDDRTLMAGIYDSTNHRFKNCWLAPYQLSSDKDNEALSYIGRRADEQQAPVTVRQCFILEGTLGTILNTLAYSSGVSGWNHSVYDTLGAGLGLAIAGSLLGPEFERSISNLPGTTAPIAVVIDKPTKFEDLMSADLLIRRAYLHWRDQGFEFGQWKTPVPEIAITELTESTKAAPSGHEENHRTSSMETDMFQRTSVTIDYCRDFASGREAKYLKSISVEDQGATDQTDGASGRRRLTLKMRNTYGDFANTGSSVESLIPGYMATMPMFSRAGHQISRSIDLRYAEGYTVGDVVTLVDPFARDPLTGRRGIDGRAAVITKHWFDFGGQTPSGSVRPMGGGIDLMFLDVHRSGTFSPAADVNSSYSSGGYSAGYLAAGPTLRVREHNYSHVLNLPTKRGPIVTLTEANDVTRFEPGDEIVIVERDPSNPASPITWARTIDSISNNDITLTVALSAPAWDATKQYRIISAPYASATAEQQDAAYQADDTDLMIQDLDPPYHFSVTDEAWSYDEVDGTAAAELIPTLSYGDGKPWDVGHDRSLAATIDNFIDHKSAHQAPMLFGGNIITGVFATYRLYYVFPVYVGLDALSTTISRVFTVAPVMRSGDGLSQTVRVTLSDTMPTLAPSQSNTANQTNARFTGTYVTASWTTTNTTLHTGTEQEMSLNVKNIHWGYVYVAVEVSSNNAICLGLGKLFESERRVA